MILKRIELAGFKSFATKTTIELLPGVTVIVGPNGCGKSNILDGIRWVLGNQSPRSMRGKTMQDVIFSGSASLKPLGAAQVTLTLDNSGRALAMDFDEVQVTRRLFRSGESEYLLNMVPCRLRDVQNLFLGTGMGTSSYSILEQGKVEQIINSKATDRRFIFEEAAGISKYKMRKLEALRKLDRTAQDLKRLGDLIDEVQRNVNSLKRQAGKAERYRKISGELRQAEMTLLTLRSAGLQGQLKQLKDEIAKLEDRVKALNVDYAREAAAQETQQSQLDENGSTIEKRRGELSETSDEITELEHGEQRLNDRIKVNDTRRGQIARETADREQRRGELAARKQEFAGRHARALADHDEAEEKFEARSRSHVELETKVTEKKQRLAELEESLTEQRGALARCENDVRIAEALQARHKETQAEVSRDIEGLKDTVQGAGERHKALEEELAALSTKVGLGTEKVTALQADHAEALGAEVGLRDELESTLRELHQSEARVAALKELKSSFEGFYPGVREVLKAAARGKINGILGPLVSLLKTRQAHEKALEVALGPHLQDVISSTADGARASMDYLVDGQLGRAVFWPLDQHISSSMPSVDPEELSKILQREGVLGHAPALVEHDDELGRVVNALLSRTIVVDSFRLGEELAGEFSTFSFVALDGRMIQSSGALAGGTSQSSGLLGREREIGELTSALSELRRKEEETQKRIAGEQSRCEELSCAIEAAREQARRLEVEKSNLQKDWEIVGRSHEDSLHALAQREESASELASEIQSKSEQIASGTEDSIRHRRLLDEIEEEIRKQREDARIHSDDFMEHGSQLAGVRAEIENAGERIGHMAESLSALEREEALLDADHKTLQDESRRLGDENDRSKDEINSIRESLETFFKQRTEMDRLLSEDQSEREQMLLGLEEAEKKMERIQRDERVVENELHEREIRYAELRTSMNNLNEQAREKFDRSIDEIAAELGEVEADAGALGIEVAQLREKLDSMGPVNLAALDDYEQQRDRLDFLTSQMTDLVESKRQIEASIASIDETTKKLFHETFEAVRVNFIEMFRRLFNGGKADLIIDHEAPDPLLDGGIEIYAQPPGKKLQTISLMSGGEKALTAISLLFALFMHKPAPFAILDEIDAPLDDANIERFKTVVSEFALKTQFMIISHNKQTMELADVIYGVTMEESGTSRIVSVHFDHAQQYLSSAG